MDVKTLGDLGVKAAPVTRERGVELPPPRPSGQIVQSVQELVAKLHNEAKAL
jgi:hypothetical protein